MKKVYLLFAVLLAPIVALHGQEKTEQLFKFYGDHSIIREVTDSNWLVYSDNDSPKFALVKDGMSNADVLVLPIEFSSVSDFVIYNNAVFFCGKLRSGKSVMGEFGLTTFPVMPILYTEITDVDTLIAIKVMDGYEYPESALLQIVMIGRKEGSGILVDALATAGGWDTYYITLKTENGYTTIHDDLAITSKHVVITSRKTAGLPETGGKPYFTNQGYVWFINKPIPAGNPLINSMNIVYNCIPDFSVVPPFLVAECGGDTCVAAVYEYGDSAGVVDLHVYFYKNTNNIDYGFIAEHLEYACLKDICHDPVGNITELLTQRNGNTYSDSRIYTFDAATAASGLSTGHKYSSQKLNSLIAPKSNSGMFIGSGIDISDNMNLNLYRYNSSSWGICTDSISAPYKKHTKTKIEKGSRTYTYKLHRTNAIYGNYYQLQITPVCESVK